MEQVGVIVVAFVVAAFVAAAEHVSVRYPATWTYLLNCLSFYLYAAMYGVIAALLAWQWPAVATVLAKAPAAPASGALLPNASEGASLLTNGSPWVRAVLIGCVAKSLTGVNLLTITIGGKPLPLGTGLVTRLFEPGLVREMAFHEYQAVDVYLKRIAALYSDIGAVRAMAVEAVPPGLEAADRDAFGLAVSGETTIDKVLGRYLGFAGRRSFRKIFEGPNGTALGAAAPPPPGQPPLEPDGGPTSG